MPCDVFEVHQHLLQGVYTEYKPRNKSNTFHLQLQMRINKMKGVMKA